jgi:hypothetical protein
MVPVLAGAVVLALLAAGLMLYRHVTRLDHDLDTATAELRGQQARAEHASATWPTTYATSV